MTDVKSTIIDEANNIVNGDRRDTYGPPLESFSQIAEYWSVYISKYLPGITIKLSPVDIANMMMLLKISRSQGGKYHRDDYVDIVGYAACVEQMVDEMIANSTISTDTTDTTEVEHASTEIKAENV